MESLQGQLLIAAPTLVDPNFHRSVVLVCAHSADGALGLILNRPTDVHVGEGVPELNPLLGAEQKLWSGGPVQSQSIVLLAELADAPEEALMVMDDIGLVLQGA